MIGALVTIAILALQLYLGVIPRTFTLQAVESVGWPYFLVVISLSFLSAGRVPAQLDAESQSIVKELTEQLELPDKDRTTHIQTLLKEVGDIEIAAIRFVLMHEEIGRQYIKLPDISWNDTGDALYKCVSIGLLRVRTEEYASMGGIFGSQHYYYVPEEFRKILTRLLYSAQEKTG